MELPMLCVFFFFFFWALSVILGRSPGPVETISCPAKAAHFSLWIISHFTFPTFLLQETVWKHNGVVNELLQIWKRGTIWGVLQHAWHGLRRFPLISSRGTDFRYYICISTCMYEREEEHERVSKGEQERKGLEQGRGEESFFLGFIIYTEIVL